MPVHVVHHFSGRRHDTVTDLAGQPPFPEPDEPDRRDEVGDAFPKHGNQFHTSGHGCRRAGSEDIEIPTRLRDQSLRRRGRALADHQQSRRGGVMQQGQLFAFVLPDCVTDFLVHLGFPTGRARLIDRAGHSQHHDANHGGRHPLQREVVQGGDPEDVVPPDNTGRTPCIGRGHRESDRQADPQRDRHREADHRCPCDRLRRAVGQVELRIVDQARNRDADQQNQPVIDRRDHRAVRTRREPVRRPHREHQHQPGAGHRCRRRRIGQCHERHDESHAVAHQQADRHRPIKHVPP